MITHNANLFADVQIAHVALAKRAATSVTHSNDDPVFVPGAIALLGALLYFVTGDGAADRAGHRGQIFTSPSAELMTDDTTDCCARYGADDR